MVHIDTSMVDTFEGAINMVTVREILIDWGFNFGWFEISNPIFGNLSLESKEAPCPFICTFLERVPSFFGTIFL